MTRNLGIWSGLGFSAIALAICANGVAPAQDKRAAAAVGNNPRSRIAIVNIQEVLKSYTKFQTVKDQIKEKSDGYERAMKNKAERMVEAEKKFKDPKTTQAEKDQIEREARTIKIEVEDIKAQARKEMQRLEQENLAQIFKEVDSTIREYAKANGIELVLRYAENWNKEDYWKDASVVNRFSMPFWPVYYEAHMEITAQITEMMNKKFAGAAQPPAKAVKQVGFQQPNE